MTSQKSELAPRAPDLVWFSGPDAVRFLNDLLSQELTDLEPGVARRSFLLGPQGKLEFMLKVFSDGEGIGLLVDPGRAQELADALGRYRIRVDVEIEVDQRERHVVVGDWDGLDISWPTRQRFLVFGDRPDLPTLDDVEYDRLRVEAGVPRWGVDVDSDTIPHESSLVPASVDFTKGCFLGQELVARIDSRGGNVPRRLRHVALDGFTPAGSVVSKDGDDVGVVTSVAGSLGLGLVHRKVGVGDSVEVGSVSGVVKSLPIEMTE